MDEHDVSRASCYSQQILIHYHPIMKLFVKSPMVFTIKLLKWGFIFAFVALIKIFALQKYTSFLVLLADCVRSVCVALPAIYSLAFVDVLVFLMKKKNKSFWSIATILLPLLLVVLLFQPFLYSHLKTLSLQNLGLSLPTVNESSPISHFFQTSSTLNSFKKQVYVLLDDFRQAYFEGYMHYLFFSFTYVFFLFSLSIFTIKARWSWFNLLTFLLAFRIFILIYNTLNSYDVAFYIFGFSSNQLKGIPTCIIIIGASSLIYVYGIVSRLKKVF